jgi:hypothetical protein
MRWQTTARAGVGRHGHFSWIGGIHTNRRNDANSQISQVIVIRMCADALSPQAYLFENDDRFFVGWYLDKSWVMCTISWGLQALCALAITLAALVLPSEGGYELIPDHDA